MTALMCEIAIPDDATAESGVKEKRNLSRLGVAHRNRKRA